MIRLSVPVAPRKLALFVYQTFPMSPDKHRTIPPDERPAHAATAATTTVRHSAFEEFRRDERRPAVLLLGALVIAALFFALGIMVGRWMADARDAPAAPVVTPTVVPTVAPTHRP